MRLTKELKLSVGVEILILRILDKILNLHRVGDNGEEIIEPRELPLNFQYKLNCNKILLENDYNKFDQARIRLLMKYGIANKDFVEVDPNKLEAYQAELNKLLDTETLHYVVKLSAEDFEDLSKDVRTALSTEEFKILLDYLVEDVDLQKAYSKDIHFNLVTPKTNTTINEVKPEVKSEVKPKTKRIKANTKKTSPKSTKRTSEFN